MLFRKTVASITAGVSKIIAELEAVEARAFGEAVAATAEVDAAKERRAAAHKEVDDARAAMRGFRALLGQAS